jgi:hypothetical protein
VPHLPPSDLHRVGWADHPSLLLGQRLLHRLPSSRHEAPGCSSRSRLQVDSRPPLLHRCWTDRVHYDESRYLLALQRRQAPLLKVAASLPS